MKLFWQGGKCRTLPNIGEANVGWANVRGGGGKYRGLGKLYGVRWRVGFMGARKKKL